MNLTTLQLNPEEATLFVEFQKRYAFMQLLNSLGIFNIKSASVVINFDSMGQIGSVEKKEFFHLPKK